MRNSKLIGFAVVAVSAILGNSAVSAADMAPAPVYTKAPAVVAAPVYNWTGFYVGADVGGDWIQGDAFTSFVQPGGGGVGFSAFNQSRSLSSSAVIGGIYGGYNWQVSNWVFGVEADFSGIGNSGVSATAPNISFPGGATLNGGFVFNRSENWLSTVRGRLGVLVAPTFLLYATGGVAFGQNNFAASYTESGGGMWQANFKNTQTGYAVGAGGEWMVSQNWLLRAEYLYVSLPGTSVVTTSTAFAPTFVVPFNWNRTNENIARVGIAYKFGGPVVAKY